MKRIHSSTWISLSIITLIPASWFVQYFLNKSMLSSLVDQFGDEVLNKMGELQILFLTIPISQLVTLATFVIPVIFARKAAREVSTNLTLPVGRSSVTEPPKDNHEKVLLNEEKPVETPPAG